MHTVTWLQSQGATPLQAGFFGNLLDRAAPLPIIKAAADSVLAFDAEAGDELQAGWHKFAAQFSVMTKESTRRSIGTRGYGRLSRQVGRGNLANPLENVPQRITPMAAPGRPVSPATSPATSLATSPGGGGAVPPGGGGPPTGTGLVSPGMGAAPGRGAAPGGGGPVGTNPRLRPTTADWAKGTAATAGAAGAGTVGYAGYDTYNRANQAIDNVNSVADQYNKTMGEGSMLGSAMGWLQNPENQQLAMMLLAGGGAGLGGLLGGGTGATMGGIGLPLLYYLLQNPGMFGGQQPKT